MKCRSLHLNLHEMILRLTWLILELKSLVVYNTTVITASKQKVTSKRFRRGMFSYCPLYAVGISKEHKIVVTESGLVLFQLGLCHYYLLTFVVWAVTCMMSTLKITNRTKRMGKVKYSNKLHKVRIDSRNNKIVPEIKCTSHVDVLLSTGGQS